MQRTFRICDALSVNMVLDKLYVQQIGFSVNLSWRLHQLRKILNEIAEYTLERLTLVFGSDYDTSQFNEDEIALYNAVMFTEIAEEIPDITLSEIVENKHVEATIEDIEKLEAFFGSNS